MKNLPFDHKKTVQALNFFARKFKGCTINKMKALKLLYFAERYHIRKYGRLITNDVCYAMPYGPVLSQAKDFTQDNYFLAPKEKRYTQKYIEPIRTNLFKSIKDIEEKVFSDSDIEALNFSFKKFGSLDEFELSNITHKYPEWKKYEKKFNDINRRFEMNYLDFFKDSQDDAIEKCHSLTEEEKKEQAEYLKELTYLENLWDN